MNLFKVRDWAFYYLICFVGLLWVAFLSAQRVMFWYSIFLAGIIIGVSVVLFLSMVRKNMGTHQDRRESQGDTAFLRGKYHG
jgi:hypothetical protein